MLRRRAGGPVAVVAAVAVLAGGLVTSAPARADARRPGNAAALMAGANKAPEATAPAGGSGQTAPDGDFTYSYPIEVPPGRRGQSPAVALRYASSAPVHGGVAAGWSLPVRAVTVDPEAGTFRPERPDGGGAADPRNFAGPDGSPMVPDQSLPVSPGGVGYRALNDTGYTRFEYLGEVASEPYWWKAFRGDGTVQRFGVKSRHPYGYAPLVSETDHTGHQLRYNYTVVGRTTAAPAAGHPREFLLSSIDYWSPGSSQAGGDQPYARVVFDHLDPVFCGNPDTSDLLPVGSRLDYRYGTGLLSGTRKLDRIITQRKNLNGTGFFHVRQYQLGYSGTDDCAAGTAAPFRELASVQQTAYSPNIGSGAGGTTVLPATRFTYGKAAAYTREEHYQPAVTVANLRMPESVDTNTVDQFGDTAGLFAPTSGFRSCDAKFCAVPGDGTANLPSSYHLSWQASAAQASGESVTRMWLDINGDGRVDLLRRSGESGDMNLSRASTAGPFTGGCHVEVYVNRGSQGFARDDALFASFSLAKAMADVPVSAGAGDSGVGELLCSLNRSFSSTSAGWQGDASKPCHTVANWGARAGWGSMQQVRHGFYDVDGDRRPDLISQPIASVHCPYASTHGVPAPLWDDPERDGVPADPHWRTEFKFRIPNSSIDPVQVTARQAYWYVYRNTGTGFEATPAKVPAGRTTDTRLNERIVTVPEPGFVGAFHAPYASLEGSKQVLGTLTDITGDGYGDFAVDSGYVLPGTKGGGFGDPIKLPDGAQNADFAPGRDRAEGSGCPGCLETYTGYMRGGVEPDVNADGLPDRVEVRDGGTRVTYNAGFGFGTADGGGQVMFSEGAADTRRLESFRLVEDSHDWQGYPTASTRYVRTRMVDLDYDGVPDVLFHNAGTGAKLYLGGGAAWVRATGVDAALAHRLGGRVTGGAMRNQFVDRADYLHTYAHKAADVNADGLLDLVEDGDGDGSVTVRYAKAILDTGESHNAPARLLRTVSNGYGATSLVSYGYDPAAGKWTATRVTVRPGQGEPEMTTRHHFRLPAFTPGPYGQSRFRGFAEVRTLRVGDPGNAGDDLTTVRLYAFDQDHRGLPRRTVTVRGDTAFTAGPAFDPAGQTGVMRVVDETYHVRELWLRAPGMAAGFSPRVVLPRATTTRTCTGALGQTADACVASAPSLVVETGWAGNSVGGKFVADLPSKVETRFVNGQGRQEIRRASPSYKVAWTSAVYRVAPDTTVEERVLDGVTTPLGVTRTSYHDGDFHYPKNVTVDDAMAGVPDRTTRYQYYGGDGARRGLPYRTWQPAQVARYGNTNDAAGFTEYAYDAHGVHVVRTTNPAGHVTTSVVDLGTGVALDVAGPDYVCPDGPDAGGEPDPATACAFGDAEFRERTVVRIDGFGRPLQTLRHAAGAGGATGVEVARATYDDAPAGGAPVSRVTRELVGDGLFSSTTTELDGLGRTLRSVVRQRAQQDFTTSYDYDAAGRAYQVFVPRGDGESGSVGVRTTYDALDRPVRVQETGSGSQVFELHTYDGLAHTVSQQTADGSPPSQTITRRDAAGQVSTIDERRGTRDSDGENLPLWATTFYAYDGAGRTASVSDSDGVTTTLVHDHSGNRRSITGAGRTWSYGYDANGNMTSITEPLPAGAQAAAYTHTTEYDDLNRVVKEIPAVRDLTAAEREEFKLGPKEYGYDRAHSSLPAVQAANQVGRLSYTSSPSVTVVNRYTPYGHLAGARQIVPALSGLVTADDLAVDHQRDAAGNEERGTYSAVLAHGTVTYEGPSVHTGYDHDGVPSEARFTVGGKSMTIQSFRNRLGLVTVRSANQDATAGFARPVVFHGHDRFGRATSLQVMGKAGGTQRYRQTLSYHDNGEVKEIAEQLGGTGEPVRTTTYSYDHRHQLTGAAQSGGTGYRGTFRYTPGGRMAAADVSATGAARPVARDVTHVYQDPRAGGDPQRLVALRRADGTDLAVYAYDEAGNTLTRALPDGTVVGQRWDGYRLRRVTRPDGEKETFFYDGNTRVAAVRHDADGTLAEVRRWFGDLEARYRPGTAAEYRHLVRIGGDAVARVDGDHATGTVEHHVGSVQGHQVLTLGAAPDATGQAPVLRTASYGAFGELLTETLAAGTPAGKYSREFNGKDRDATAGLHYYGYRYYDPLALQWTSTDPKYRFTPDTADPRRANLYTYTRNNPVGLVDPDGLEDRPVNGSTFAKQTHYNGGGVGTLMHVEVNATNAEISAGRRTWGTSAQLDVGHLETSVADGNSAEAMLVTVYGPAIPDAESGGTWQVKAEVGIFGTGGLLTGADVTTYTSADGLTYEAPGMVAANAMDHDDDGARDAARGLIAYGMMLRARAEDARRKAWDGPLDQMGAYGMCTPEHAECAGPSHPETEKRVTTTPDEPMSRKDFGRLIDAANRDGGSGKGEPTDILSGWKDPK
ncbi:RHS repeat-associated core domain-containing protein [Streptosporangium sp. H16]|uniref:RHS repeat-associated core domain-containing protein n=1 Tax=Streptosporangium sp. H16 TaxID=3444184 RepID=UPI003F7A381D